MNVYSASNLDLYRRSSDLDKGVRKADLSVLATAQFKGGQLIATPSSRQRYIWPNPYSQNRSGFLSRKVYAR